MSDFAAVVFSLQSIGFINMSLGSKDMYWSISKAACVAMPSLKSLDTGKPLEIWRPLTHGFRPGQPLCATNIPQGRLIESAHCPDSSLFQDITIQQGYLIRCQRVPLSNIFYTIFSTQNAATHLVSP